MRTCRFAWLTLWLLLAAPAAKAQFALTPLQGFGSSGWLAPNGYNGSTYAYLTTSDTERGLAWWSDHLYLVSRAGGDFVRILDAQSGQDLGALNLGTAVVTGGTFNVNMVAVGGDGAIYVANLATGPTPFRIYRWANDQASTTPTVVYNGVPLAGARVGDSLAAIGNGSSTRLVAGFNSAPSVTGNNGYAIIDPGAGTATAVVFNGTPPNAGDFRLAISFTDSGHVVGTQGGGLLYTSFAGAAGTLLASPALASSDERPMSFATVGGFPLLAVLSTGDNHLSLYDLTDPTNPALVGQANATTGTLPADSHNTGAVAWGVISSNTATLYAMASDDGIQAFRVTTPAPSAPVIVGEPQDQTVAELGPATFSVAATGNPAPTYQWYQNGSLVPGVVSTNYTLAAAPLSANGAQIQVVVQNLMGNLTHAVTSRVAVLTVVPDTTPPGLLRAQQVGLSQVEAFFSERISVASATNPANYSIQSADGALLISSATLDVSQSNVVLSVGALAEGVSYTLTVNHLTDQSAAGNVITPGAQASFTATAFALGSIGSPVPAGNQTIAGTGYDLASGGSDIGGTADQASFSYQLRTGDFDVATRLAGLSPSDVWAKAGLMARETLDPGSRFAAVLGTPAMVGTIFEWRDPTGTSANSRGTFPVNYPNTWLRLKRSGNTFTGFVGYDGQVWTQLGSAVIVMTNQVYLGLAVSSHSAGLGTVAQFRDVADTVNPLLGTVPNPYEPLGPCSRRTGIVISEIMYHAAPRTDGRKLEYVEIYNSNPWWENIGGYRLTGDVLYRLPPGTILPGGAFLVIAAAPADVQSVYGITNVVGPYTPSDKKTGLLQLRDEQDSILLDMNYSSSSPWPAGADGTGHSIVLARPSYGEADPRAWAISDVVGGSPGMMEAYRPTPLRNVVLNEFLAHPDASRRAYIELYNHSPNAVDLTGCVLTDDPTTNRFTLPPNSIISPGGFLAFDASQMGFTPSPARGRLLFKSPDGSRVLDALTYEAQALNASWGRWPDGASEFYRLAANTPGASNGDIYIGDVVLNELMYKPISGDDDDQYVELYNQGTNAVDLSGWTFTAGIHYTFAPNTVLAPGGYLVVARNLSRLLGHYPQLNAANAVGDYTGKLSHKGDRVALARPEDWVSTDSAGTLVTNTIFAVEDEVTYQTGGRWGQWAAGGGSSLELINPRTNHRLPDNWADSDETAKSSWTSVEFTGLLDNGANYGSTIDLVQLGLLDVGECLVDNVEVVPAGGGANYISNPDFENGLTGWTPQGDHIRSSLETGLGGYLSSQCLHLRASDGVWTLFNSVQGNLNNTTLHSGQTVTMRLKGRWLRGSPEILMRLHGNWLELTGALPVPTNLGTPGQRNSQFQPTPDPAIFAVQHSPAIPLAGQSVVVTARFHDENGIQPSLLYRLDTIPNAAPSYTTVTMVDDGTGGDALAGDGVYSAQIPAQSAGTVVAFLVQARNALGGVTTFPKVRNDNSGLPRECVVVFGDPIPAGAFDHEHVWMTQNWVRRWSSLGGLSNETHDGTFVDGDSGRIIYNWVGRPAGSPYHQYTGSPVTTLGGEHWTLPEDDKLFGTTSFNKQHLPGNGPLDDDTLQREQTSYWMARQVGVPWDYRRFYILYVNGNRHGPLMEDSQVPGADMLKQHWPNDNNGFLYKNNSWFEGTTTIDGSGYLSFKMPTWCLLGSFTTTINGVPGQYKLGRYRWMYWIRQYPDSANNFTNIFALIAAANLPTSNPAYYSSWEATVDTEEFMWMSALEHATGDWDSWFTQNQWNMYIYKPMRGKWTALKWDWNITLGGGTTTWPSDGSQLFSVGAADPIMARFQTYTPYRRTYLHALKEIAARAMNNTYADPELDKKYAAFAASGISAREPGAAGLKNWIRTMHTSILRALTNQGVANLSFTVAGPSNFSTAAEVVTLTGTAPVEVKNITVNHAPLPITWTGVGNWQMTVPLTIGVNVLNLQGVDLRGNTLSNLTASVSITSTNSSPVTLNPVVINEWMANNNNILADPADGMVHDWFELYNPNFALVDLSGFYLTDKLAHQTKWQIPAGTVLPPYGFLLVWADGGLSSTDHDLHAGFKLAKSGGSIGLFDPQTNLVDSVTFGPQKADISQGRWPDGGAVIYFLSVPTASGPNQFTNSPPVLAELPTRTAVAGNPFTYMVTATDPDSPPQALTFSLDPGAPTGASINPTNGVFNWSVPIDQPAGINVIAIRVTDNGVPTLSNVGNLVVVVQGIVLGGIGLNPAGQPTFTWNAQPGRTYRVEWKANLADPAWQMLADLVATGPTLSFTDPAVSSFPQRFFRVSLLP